MATGDKRQVLTTMVDTIVAHLQPEKIVLFGSMANGSDFEPGDIDLLVVKDTDQEPWTRLAEVDRLISHEVPVDVLVYTPSEIQQRLEMNDFFIKDILEKGVVLHEE